ncbi:MAG: hypothetical protein IH807_11305 [Proteobacteria bacterium]|nr:hypothetical protein [Pseudomonadota bacterium]
MPASTSSGICPAAVSTVPTHAEFASRVSTHREAVTREESALERAGHDGGDFLFVRKR